MADPGKVDTTKKHFVPLENNPEVFTHLVHLLGVSPELGFYDIYSIDEPELLAFIPRPVHALIFICPAKAYYKTREEEDETIPAYDGSGEAEPIVWFKQTIGNACGLIGCLHAVCNGGARNYIQPGSDLEAILKEAIPLKPSPRADVLYNSQALEVAHASAAQKGDTAPPPSFDHVGQHFIAFVKGDDGRLWELEGGWKGPLDRGVLSEDDDALSEKALQLGVRRFIKNMGEDLRFSIVALASSLD
ncbi:cysteine proteinase [Mytilinidion resinicola]|uniref:Ubiquitin carboxyl-terminal hydrolase n=1 Tax=Mytilinidion resinicola TaxID=574789 RepID=A0A6A6YRE0_9PEZI|nr:cysteine proteinase [Mytilinidion resinicola]KAF2811089.1 cysteine proteinase [Mytilinidion resinicola]